MYIVSEENIFQVAVVATVSQQMDEDGQLVVRIESIEVDQKVLDSIEPTCREEDPIDISSFKDEIANTCEMNSELVGMLDCTNYCKITHHVCK